MIKHVPMMKVVDWLDVLLQQVVRMIWRSQSVGG